MPPGIPGKCFEVATARCTRPDLRVADGTFGGYRSMHGTDLAAAQGAGLAAYWLDLRMNTVERASAPIAIKNHFLATKRGRDAWDLAYNDVENLLRGTSSFGPPREHPPMLQPPARRALSLKLHFP